MSEINQQPLAARGLPRGFDLIMSVLGLVVLSPLLLLAGMAVLLTSRGGALFSQRRVGRYGQPFVMYKLRTMDVTNHGPQVTISNDVRITTVGRFLRQTKLDELPTLWNVLKGDMALVGPRPEVPDYVELKDAKWQQVLTVRPGITDPVTLQLRNEEMLLARVRGDSIQYYANELLPLKLNGYVSYLERRSWQSDLTVLLRTVVAVVFRPEIHPELN